jgi:hypothetical protein
VEYGPRAEELSWAVAGFADALAWPDADAPPFPADRRDAEPPRAGKLLLLTAAAAGVAPQARG